MGIKEQKRHVAKELAARVGISVGALHYYETNQHSPTLDLLYDLAIVMGVDLCDMFETPG